MAATIVYGSSHISELRVKIQNHIRKICRENKILFSENEIPWYLSREEKQFLYALQIS